ncbi:uncharacterized protein BT62DRAFT_934844 [Guyanagaster necrorhizus]|uniref:Uncharacterized protein n=1 Tax=Guyanagaster necrorhizus TaxID=856835 RepID=A0A9P7VNJ5_9AGAR|nr:uncharacterized protein BT62DRAFT_934844 [Guyanagaster necrorhizus MCA 3950]KAG7443610.1 hypothetical protein BT62DRAFT_934844 [Guyanagaster necrorhizus MCA 3950]
MDNPWTNAWGDDTRPHHSPSPPTRWSVPATSDSDHEEADIGIPSWSSTTLQWNEPTDIHTSLWGEKLKSKFSLANADHKQMESTAEPDVTLEENVPSSPGSPHDSPVASPEVETSVFNPPSLILPSFRGESTEDFRPESRPRSPDAFGSFETGLRMGNTEANLWTPSKPSFPDLSDPASSSWEADWTPADVGSETELFDEWDIAKREKARRDSHVPPELLASVVQRFEQLSHDLWPDQSDDKDEANLQSIEDMQDLSSAIQKIVPDNLTIPPHADFSRTFISKRTAETLKFTRHVPMVRISPLARYVASKGSTAWEASVKAQPELSQDDFVPAGWRLIPKEKDVAPSVMDTKQKSAGGLLSFFGRRSMTPPVTDRPVSPVAKANTGASVSPRTSIDTHRRSFSSSSPVISSPLSPAPSASPSSSLPPPPDRAATPPPSAVSRFLTRFSRTKPTISPRNSIALSSDDLEFLSDIVPSVSDDVDPPAPLSMVESPPLPEKLPPPLAPPSKSRLANGVPKSNTILPDGSLGILPLSYPSQPLQSSLQASSLMDTMILVPSAPETVKSSRFVPSRNTTPVTKPMPSPTLCSTPSPFQLSKRIPTAIMSSNPIMQSAVPPFSFTLPPPSTSRQQTPVPSPPSTAPAVCLHSPVPQNATAQLSLFDEEFSDFHTIPALGDGASSSAHADASFSSFSSEQSLFSSASSNGPHNADGFDDFDDFVQPPLRTPSPPAVPEKTSSARPPKIMLASSLPIRSPTRSPAQLPPQKRKVNRSEHQRTLSLMESAAAHGKWPAPPSPIPPPLEPPPGGVKKAVQLDIFGGDESISLPMQQAQINAIGTLTVSQSSPEILAPMQPASAPLLRPPQNHVHTPTSNNAVSMKTGGLSAQELSFFEGV